MLRFSQLGGARGVGTVDRQLGNRQLVAAARHHFSRHILDEDRGDLRHDKPFADSATLQQRPR